MPLKFNLEIRNALQLYNLVGISIKIKILSQISLTMGHVAIVIKYISDRRHTTPPPLLILCFSLYVYEKESVKIVNGMVSSMCSKKNQDTTKRKSIEKIVQCRKQPLKRVWFGRKKQR